MMKLVMSRTSKMATFRHENQTMTGERTLITVIGIFAVTFGNQRDKRTIPYGTTFLKHRRDCSRKKSYRRFEKKVILALDKRKRFCMDFFVFSHI